MNKEQLLRLRDRLYRLMANFTGKDYETIHRDFDRNKWLFAEEAVEYGVSDKILEAAPVSVTRHLPESPSAER